MTIIHRAVRSAELDPVKVRHREMWTSGDYATLATEIIWALGPRVVEAAGIRPGDRMLDIAAGNGNVAIPAALRGASVVASDLTPKLLERGRRIATASGAELEWREADAERLPFADGSFDVATSCVGIMFAPHHQQAADEMLRVTRSGGRIAMLNWTPGGFIGQLFATLAPYNAPLPAGASPAPLWGDPAHVGELLGDRVIDLRATKGTLRVDRFPKPGDFRRYFATNYGPTISVYARHADNPATLAEIDAALDDLALGMTDANGVMEWEYLLSTATVR